MNFPNEQAFTDAVVGLFKMAGFRVMHMRGNTKRQIQGHAGYPDIIATRGGRLIFAELKMDKGVTSTEQETWLHELDKSVAEVYLWRPMDWDEIQRIILTRESS